MADSEVGQYQEGDGGAWKRLLFLLPPLLVIAFVYFHYITYTQLASHHIYLADVGVFDVVCSGPWHGNGLRSPLAWNTDANYFAGHFRPIFFLIIPFYGIYDGALTYLTLQNLSLVLAAWPLALYAFAVTRNTLFSLAMAILYLCNHFVGSVHLANHPEAIGFLFLFLIFWAAETRRITYYIIGFLGAAMVKEDYGIYLAVFGIALLFDKDRFKKKLGAATIGAAIVWLVFAALMMRLSGQEAMEIAGNQPISRWASMGDSPGSILLFMVTHPHIVLVRLFRPAVFWLFASTGFLALIDWKHSWMIIAAGGIFLMADDVLIANLHYYYSYSAIPFLFYSTVRGGGYLIEKASSMNHRAGFGLSGYLILTALVSFVLPTRTDGLRRVPFTVLPHHELASEIINNEIPDDVSIAVQYDLYTKVPNRETKLPMRLWALDHVDWVFLDLKGRPADLFGEEKREEREAVYSRLQSDEYREVYGDWNNLEMSDGYLVLVRVNTR